MLIGQYNFEVGPHLLVGMVLVALILAVGYASTFKHDDENGDSK